MSGYAPENTASQPANAAYSPPPGNQQPTYYTGDQPSQELVPYNPDPHSVVPANSAPPPQNSQLQYTKVDDDHSGPYASTKHGFADRLAAFGRQAASPINQLANRMGSEGFLPMSLDKECEKAARILQAFCKDGISTDLVPTDRLTPKQRRAIITIPAKVLQRAAGLAIFTTGRVGIHLSGATGSGILIARMPDGRWSPPSGIQIHSLGAGFVVGADIYDCVLVMNTREALDAFRNTRLSLGSDVAVVAGPWGAGGSVDIAAGVGKGKGKGKEVDDNSMASSSSFTRNYNNPNARVSMRDKMVNHAVYSYIKSRGVYCGVQIDGTAVTSRTSANAAFYGAQVSVTQILRGELPHGGNWEWHVGQLVDTITRAEGRGQDGKQTEVVDEPGLNQRKAIMWANAAPDAIVTAGQTDMGTEMHTAGSLDDFYPQSGPISPVSEKQVHVPLPPPPPMTKAQEAAMESAQTDARARDTLPGYSMEDLASGSHDVPDDLPPAYTEEPTPHPGVGDHKTHH